MKRSTSACLLSIAVAFVSPIASAQSSERRPSVQLLVDACVGADRAEVERIATLELRPSAVRTTAVGEEPANVRVEVSCTAIGVRVRVDDSITRKILERVVRVRDVDERARARWVAIAAAELVRASWSELDDEPPPRAEPAQPAPPIELVRAAQRTIVHRAPGPTVGIAASSRAASSLAMWGSFSGGVRALSASYGAQVLGLVVADWGVGWTRWLQSRVGLAYMDGSRAVRDGLVRASVFEARASLQVAMSRGPLGIAFGAGFAAGPALFTPRAANAIEATTRSAIVAWGGAFVLSEVSVTVRRGWLQLFFAAEAGVVTFASSANVVHSIAGTQRTVEPALALEGVWGSAVLGLRAGRM